MNISAITACASGSTDVYSFHAVAKKSTRSGLCTRRIGLHVRARSATHRRSGPSCSALHDAVDPLRHLEPPDDRAGVDVVLGIVGTVIVAGDDGERRVRHAADCRSLDDDADLRVEVGDGLHFDAATRALGQRDGDPLRLGVCHDLAGDLGGQRLGEHRTIAKSPQVQLQALRFDAPLIGRVFDDDIARGRAAR